MWTGCTYARTSEADDQENVQGCHLQGWARAGSHWRRIPCPSEDQEISIRVLPRYLRFPHLRRAVMGNLSDSLDVQARIFALARWHHVIFGLCPLPSTAEFLGVPGVRLDSSIERGSGATRRRLYPQGCGIVIGRRYSAQAGEWRSSLEAAMNSAESAPGPMSEFLANMSPRDQDPNERSDWHDQLSPWPGPLS
jgi:hypothetical protein